MWLDAGPDTYQFEGVDGEVHSFPGPSVVGAIEFEVRTRELGQVMDSNQHLTGVGLYKGHPRFRWLVNRCLEIHGINPLWVSWPQIERLLFGYVDEAGGLHGALLVEAMADAAATPQPDAKPATIAELIASLAPAHGGIQGAIAVLQNLSPRQLGDILQAQKKTAEKQDPNHSEKEGMRAFRKRLEEEALAREGNQNG